MSDRKIQREFSIRSANALADIINGTQGAPVARAWLPDKGGTAPRVYVGNVGYFTLERSDVEGHRVIPGLRQRLTLNMSGLYPSQRRALAKAMETYQREYARGAMQEAEEAFANAAEREIQSVLGATQDLSSDGPTTSKAIAEATGISRLRVITIVKMLHEEGEVLAKHIGTAQERIFA